LRIQERTSELVIANDDLQKQASLLNLAHDAIFVVDSAGVVSFWNKGAEDLYGFTREQAIANFAGEFLQTKFLESFELVVNQVIDKGQWAGELRQTTSMGEDLYEVAFKSSASGGHKAQCCCFKDLPAFLPFWHTIYCALVW
jgi:PAS domain S-box-containing protein